MEQVKKIWSIICKILNAFFLGFTGGVGRGFALSRDRLERKRVAVSAKLSVVYGVERKYGTNFECWRRNHWGESGPDDA